jgi:putative zinc finger protein
VQHSQLTCREFVVLIRRLRDDELSEVDRRSFLQHLGECSRCANYLKGYELTISAAKRIAEDSRDSDEKTIPKSLISKILDARLEQQRGSQSKRPRLFER